MAILVPTLCQRRVERTWNVLLGHRRLARGLLRAPATRVSEQTMMRGGRQWSYLPSEGHSKSRRSSVRKIFWGEVDRCTTIYPTQTPGPTERPSVHGYLSGWPPSAPGPRRSGGRSASDLNAALPPGPRRPGSGSRPPTMGEVRHRGRIDPVSHIPPAIMRPRPGRRPPPRRSPLLYRSSPPYTVRRPALRLVSEGIDTGRVVC